MRVRSLRRVTPPTPSTWAMGLALTLAGVLAGCAPPEVRFLRDRSSRRASLEASLVDDAGHYGRERRENYALDRWENLPVWNPPVSALRVRDGVVVDEEGALALTVSPAAAAGDRAALIELGRRAFSRYPAQRAPFDPRSFTPEDRATLGLWTDDDAGLAGLVTVHYPGGTTATAVSCATCHAQRSPGHKDVVHGAANVDLDFGALMIGAAPSSSSTAALLAWGPGRLDVTTRAGTEPALIPDLRATRHQAQLQHAGAVVQRDITSLAVRLETLIIVAHDGAIRPPREVGLGLALYLWSLADSLPALDVHARGHQVFVRACARCHEGEGLAGGLVDVDVVGTDAALALSAERGTGGYRTTSLRGLGSRRRLLHDGSVHSITDLLDPARREHGHFFGQTLPTDERAALVAWLLRL